MALTRPQATKFWTYEDLLELPDDGRRREIIDGELFELATPPLDHASTVMALIMRFAPVVSAVGGRLFTGPLDVFFGGADPVEPDLMILLPEHLGCIKKRGIEGPPDILIEALSPSNPEHDRIRKRALYARGGVREYWLASPEAASIEVLVLVDGAYRTHIRAAGDEIVTSNVLADLAFPASEVFIPIAA